MTLIHKIRNWLRLDHLRSQMVFWMVTVSTIPLLVLFAGLFYYVYLPLLDSFIESNRSVLKRHLLVEQTSEAGRLADQIDNFLRKVQDQGMALSQLLSMDFISSGSRQRIVSNLLNVYKDIDWVVIRGVDDRVRSVGRETVPYSDQITVMIQDPVLFQRTLAGELAYSQPFVQTGLDYVTMVMTLPVMSDVGVPIGALYLQVNLSKIQSLTDQVNKNNPGIIYVVDSEGILLGHVDRKHVLAREDMRDVEIVGKYLIPRITAGSIPYENKNGEPVQGAYAPISDLHWGVVAERSHKIAFSSMTEMVKLARATLRQLTYATIAGLISTIILAAGIGILLAIRISSPIQEISMGAISIASGDFSQRFKVKGSEDIQQLAGTLNYMSEEIENYTRDLANQAQKMRELFIGSVESLAAAIDAKDPYTQGHSRRVTTVSMLIGRRMNLSGVEIEELEIAALMHDVGKLGVDDAILKKPGKVTDEELAVLQQHPEFGADIMRHIPLLNNMIPGMLHHHERWDGSGYPFGLKEEEISMYGRIIAVADTFDAMTSDRPYQKALSFEDVNTLISGWAETRYDPAVVAAFKDVFDEICHQISEVRT